MTELQLHRTKVRWQKVTKEEKIDIEEIKGVLYAFGSELACLRLLYYYYFSKNTRANYSKPRKSWFFCLELENV